MFGGDRLLKSKGDGFSHDKEKNLDPVKSPTIGKNTIPIKHSSAFSFSQDGQGVSYMMNNSKLTKEDEETFEKEKDKTRTFFT